MYKKEFVYKEFLRKEENILRAPYNPELEFYSVIKSGDVKKAKELCKEPFSEKQGLGVLSKNPLQNIILQLLLPLLPDIALMADWMYQPHML